MPRTRSLAWAELKFGLIAVFALVMAGLLIFAVGGGGGFFWQTYSLRAKFDNVAGLMAGSPVRVAGVQVGAVDEVVLSAEGVEVIFTVKDDFRPLVTDKSKAVLGTISLLGEGAVDITAGPGGTPIPEGGYVPSGIAEGSIAQLTTEATSGLQEARLLVSDLRNGKGTMGKLFTDESLYKQLDAFVTASEQVARSIATGKGTAGRLANDPKLYEELNASVANLNAITAKIRNGEGSLGQLMNDPSFSKSLNQTTANLEGLTAKLNRGEGTAGQLLHDKQLYENMNQTVAEMRALIAEIRKDPKKYLNVKVSIF